MEQNKDQSGAAVRGEAVAEERWCLACDKAGHRTDECGSTYATNTPQARELIRLCHASIDSKVSHRAADAPSEPSEPLLTMAQVNAIRDTIKPGDGWDGDNWDFALANAVAASVKSRAADALDSQPTNLATQPWISVLEAMPAQYREVHLKHRDGYVRIGRWSIKGGGSWQLACYGAGEQSLWRKDDVTHWCTLACDISSQPTDGGVRNG